MATRFPRASRSFLLVLAGALACGGDLLLPDPPGGGEVVLSIVDGDDQIGVVGEELEGLLVVKVRTGRGQAVVGQEVAFVFTDAAGVVTPSRAITNSEGEAQAKWVLGSEPGQQAVAAQLVVADTVEPQVQEFTAEAKPGAPHTLSAKTPTSQPGRRNEEVGTQPMVQVVDRFGNPVPEVSVAWRVSPGGGQVSEALTSTDATGAATVKWTLGSRRGVQRLTAEVGPGPVTGSPMAFTATVLF